MKRINKTQCICEALNKGMKITPLVAWKLCKTFTLAEIIRNLRKRYGMNIVTDYVTENECRYGIYHLAKRSKTMDNGTIKKATFSVAVSEKYKDRNGEAKENTNWFTCVFFGKMADVIDKLNVEKGTLVYVSGKMNFRQYTKDTGEKTNIAELMGDVFQILSSRRSDGSIQPTANAPTAEAEEDELPF